MIIEDIDDDFDIDEDRVRVRVPSADIKGSL